MRIHLGVQHLSTIVRFEPGFEIVELTRMMHARYREATLRRLAEAAPDGSRFVVAVPQAITDPEWEQPSGAVPAAALRGFAPGPALDDQLTALARAAGLLRAQTVLIRTPVSFRPTARNLERLGAFARHPKLKGLRLAWQADGLWEPARLTAACEELGLTPVLDPLAGPAPMKAADFAYFRVRGATPSRLIPELAHLDLIEACRPYRRVFLVFCTANPVQDARNFLENAALNGVNAGFK